MYKSVLIGGINKAVRHRDFPLHKHYEDELYVCFGGSATDIVEGKGRTVISGDVYVHKKGVTHRQKDVKDFYCCVFQFDRCELVKRSREMGIIDKDGLASLLDDENTDEFFVDTNTVRYAEVISDVIKSEQDPVVRDIMFMNLLVVICSKLNVKTGERNPDAWENVGEIVRYIENNYDKPLTLETLASLSHYSRRHFTRLFREVCGVSPMEYLNKIRIKNASDLLVKSDMSIKQISRLCGFEDNNLFSRRFKEAYKISPSDYRRSCKAK